MSKANILIIDDDVDIVESMKVVLESKGYGVIIAGSAAEGIKKAKAELPDLIILDVMMETGDSGFGAAREIKGDEKCKSIPILMLTAIAGKTGFDFKSEAGDEAWLPVDAYADKPLKPEELISKVEALLNK
ncbi:MAG: response regulator [Candidatus Omnitrophota bacterium]